jgi:hypothetical protein
MLRLNRRQIGELKMNLIETPDDKASRQVTARHTVLSTLVRC